MRKQKFPVGVAVFCLAAAAWADVTVVFNEVMYHPPQTNEAAFEWVELRNQMAVDMDLSGWTVEGGIDFRFPENAVIPGRGYLVVAGSPVELTAATGATNVFGPFTGRLSNSGETLELRNNNHRLMDELAYGTEDAWPVAADGAGPSLAKIDEDAASADPANWRASLQMGGSPGKANPAVGSAATGQLYETQPITTLFSSGLDAAGQPLSPGQADPHYTLTASAYSTPPPPAIRATVMANHPAWLANDATSRWIGATASGLDGVPGGNYTFRTTFDLSGMETNGVSLSLRFAVDNGLSAVYLNGVSKSLPVLPWEQFGVFSPYCVISNGFASGVNTLDFYTANYTASPNPAGFRVEASGTSVKWLPTLALNELPSVTNPVFWAEIVNYGSQSVNLTNYIFKRFGATDTEYVIPAQTLSPGVRLLLNRADLGFGADPGDKLVLYMPDKTAVLDAVFAKHYPRARWPEGTGPWLHPSESTPGTTNRVALRDDIVINEIMYHPRTPQGPATNSPEQWIEFYNRGTGTVDLAGWRLEINGETAFRFPAGRTLAAGGYLVVALDAAFLQGLYPSVAMIGNLSKRLPGGGGKLELFDAAGLPLDPAVNPDAAGNPVDVVRYGDVSPWPSYAAGLGASLELRDPRADNSRPEAWAASDDRAKVSWQTYTYRGTATVETASSPTLWNEFVLGLIGEGEVLLDDVSVVESPSGTPVQLLQNRTFETGATAWRIIGNHRSSEVIVDPDNAANHVLRLVSDGYTEHMHNHAETTLANGASVVNGREYQISFRAKWVAGCNRLLTRLYFNRLPQLTEIATPSRYGTPGARNSRYAANLGPTFSGLSHSPVVPTGGQAVSVSVSASDPDGVKTGVLYYAVNSGSWQSLPMTAQAASGGGVTLGATMPGQAAGSVVQFYVEASDTLSVKSTCPADGTSSRALFAVSDGTAIQPRLHTVRIVMTPADTTYLHSSINVMSNERLGCTLITDERTVAYDAGLHLQGSERGRDAASRVGFTVRMPSDRLYRGVLDGFTVDRSGGYSGRGGTQDELLLKHAINKAGGLPGMYDDLCQVFAPRTQDNGTGLFILAKYDSEFLDTQYASGGDGDMFKLELIYYPYTTLTGDVQSYKLPQPDDVLNTDIGDLGSNPESYRWTFLKENHTDRNNYAPMVALAKAFSLTGTALDTKIKQLMDVDEWMRGVAFFSLIGCPDMYTYGYSHNTIFYFRPEDGKGMLFPWDMDFAFYSAINDVFPGQASPNTTKIINLPANLHAYYGHLYDLASVTGDSAYMGRWASHYAGLVGQNWGAAVTYLKDRADYVRSQMPAAAAFAITNNLGNSFTVTNSPVTLGGTGSYTVKSIKVNGVDYPVTWTGVQNWTLTVPLSGYANPLSLQAYDLHGNLLTNVADTITVTNTGTPAPFPVVINEWMADNGGPGGYPDASDQKFQDWFELYNPNSAPVNLSGFTLTDDLTKPAKWLIPTNTVIAQHGFLLVWADDEAAQNGNGTNSDLHAAFKLNNEGEAIGLFSPAGVRQHAVTFGQQIQNVSQGLYPDGNTNAVYSMSNWTPRASNRLGSPQAPDIVAITNQPSHAATISLLTSPEHAYVVQYKNALQAPVWLPLCTNRALADKWLFTDTSAAGVTQRFYRAVLLQ